MKTLRQQVDTGEFNINISDEDIKLWDEVQSYNQFKASFSFELLDTYKQQKAFHIEKEQKLWFNEVNKVAKYYNATLIEEAKTGNIHYDFRGKDLNSVLIPIKKLKAVTINDKTIRYTHCIPSSVNLTKLTWKQRLKILLGIKVNVIINTYLNAGKIELTILKIEE